MGAAIPSERLSITPSHDPLIRLRLAQSGTVQPCEPVMGLVLPQIGVASRRFESIRRSLVWIPLREPLTPLSFHSSPQCFFVPRIDTSPRPMFRHSHPGPPMYSTDCMAGAAMLRLSRRRRCSHPQKSNYTSDIRASPCPVLQSMPWSNFLQAPPMAGHRRSDTDITHRQDTVATSANGHYIIIAPLSR